MITWSKISNRLSDIGLASWAYNGNSFVGHVQYVHGCRFATYFDYRYDSWGFVCTINKASKHRRRCDAKREVELYVTGGGRRDPEFYHDRTVDKPFSKGDIPHTNEARRKVARRARHKGGRRAVREACFGETWDSTRRSKGSTRFAKARKRAVKRASLYEGSAFSFNLLSQLYGPGANNYALCSSK